MDLMDKIPVIDVIEDVFNIRKGEYGVGFEFTLSEVFSLDVEDMKIIHQYFVQVFSMLPNNSVLHKQDWILSEKYEPETKKFNDHVSRSVEFFFNEKSMVNHKCYLFITQSTPKGMKRSRSLTVLRKDFFPDEILKDTTFNKFMDAVAGIESYLGKSVYFKIRRLKEIDYYGDENKSGLFDMYLNINGGKQINDIAFKDLFTVGNKRCSYISVNNLECFPEQISISAKDRMYKYPFSFLYELGYGLKFNHIFNQVFFKEDQQITKQKLISRHEELKMFSFKSTVNNESAEGLNEFIKESVSKGKIILKANLNVLTWNEENSRLIEQEAEIKTAFQNLGFYPKNESEDAPFYHWACFPGNASDLPVDVMCTVNADVAACLLCNETGYADTTSDFGMKLVPRGQRVPKLVDFTNEPFKKELVFNKHKFGVGYSGGGKSNFTAEYIRNMVEFGGHAIVVEMGRSFERLGSYIREKGKHKVLHLEYRDDKPLSFNPFWVTKKEDVNGEKLTLLLALILGICAGIDIESNNLEVLQKVAVMRQLILNYYKQAFEKKFFPCMNTFYEFLLHTFNKWEKEQNRDLQYLDIYGITLVLRDFYKGGVYEYIFNSKVNLDLKDIPLIIFELDSINDNKMLMSIVTTMIMTAMMDKIFKLKLSLGDGAQAINKLLLIDECWKPLMEEKFATYLGWCARTLRKHNGELFPVTQDLGDLLNNEFISDVLISQTPTKIFFDLSGYKENIEKVCKVLGLSNKEKDLVKSLNKNIEQDRRLREVMIKIGDESRVYAFEATPFQLALYTTSTEKTAVNRFISDCGSVVNGIENYLYSKQK
jgi:conjugation system TraG family ATPase